MGDGPSDVLAPHLVDLLASVHAAVGSAPEETEPAEQMARQNQELLATQSHLVAALHAQQLLVMQQEREMRRLRSALSLSERSLPRGGEHPMGSPMAPFDLTPLGDSRDHGAVGALEPALPIPRELHEKLAFSIPLQQGLLYAALDTLTTNSCTAPIDSSSHPLNCVEGHATATHRRSIVPAVLLETPPPTLPVSA